MLLTMHPTGQATGLAPPLPALLPAGSQPRRIRIALTQFSRMHNSSDLHVWPADFGWPDPISGSSSRASQPHEVRVIGAKSSSVLSPLAGRLPQGVLRWRIAFRGRTAHCSVAPVGPVYSLHCGSFAALYFMQSAEQRNGALSFCFTMPFVLC